MGDATVVDDVVSLAPSPSATPSDFDSFVISSLDHPFFPQDFTFSDTLDNNSVSFLSSFGDHNVANGDFDLDFNFDDIDLLSNPDDFVNSITSPLDQSDSFSPGHIREPELRHVSIDQTLLGPMVANSSSPILCQLTGDQSVGASALIEGPSGTFRSSDSPSQGSPQHFGDQMSDVSKLLNVPSLESSGNKIQSSQSYGNIISNASGASNCSSPDSVTHDPVAMIPVSSQGSENCASNGSENMNCPSPDSENSYRSVHLLPDFTDNSEKPISDQNTKLEEVGNNVLLKRKNENEDLRLETRINKYQRSNAFNSNVVSGNNSGSNAMNEDEEKKRARLMRNRESAQLSRQRKKHYVEELEDKVRTMHSTIQDLNSKISYIIAENATLRQQLGNNPVYPPPGMYPPPHPQMVYPWMPCPPYMVKSQGSQVPLVPIPKLKPQQPISVAKAKKVESKKSDVKTKKVASVSFFGLLFFVLLFGGFVPMYVKYERVQEEFQGRVDYTGSRFHVQHQEHVLTSNSYLSGNNFDIRNRTSSIHCTDGHIGSAGPSNERGAFGPFGNGSEPLVASLYVPRNDKLVKIDGNLIIHSVLASEKAMESNGNSHLKRNMETGLAVSGNLGSLIPGRHPHLYRGPTERQRALGSGSEDRDNLKSTSDGKLQQWFREGLAGPMLSSGMCTEVFQFDVSPATGAIVPATTTSSRNISAEHSDNSTQLNKGRSRRILNGLPVPLSRTSNNNITKEHMDNAEKARLFGNKSVSSMVVSVLVDPREVGDSSSDRDGVMGPRSLSRIFVVVLLDSVKYVTYSCMLPFKGTGSHLVTT